MYIFYTIGTFEALFLAVLLILKKNKNISDNILASYFLLFGITILLTFFDYFNIKNDFKLPQLIALSHPFIFLHGPILWLYTKSITTSSFKLKPRDLLHILPFAIMFIHLSIKYYFLPPEIKISLLKSEVFKHDFNYIFYVLGLPISVFTYLFWSISLLIKHIKILKKANISLHKMDLKWMKFLFISAVFVYGVTFSTNILDLIFHFLSFSTFQFIAHMLGSIFILALGFYGHKQSNIFSSYVDKNNYMIDNSFIENIDSDIKSKDLEFVKQISKFMENDKPYIDANLNLAGMAKKLSVSPDYLSEIINNKLKMNFLDFINSYRINEFNKRLKNNKNLTILSIAYDSGFNSKATFNRVFMKKMKMTPSQYKQIVSNN